MAESVFTTQAPVDNLDAFEAFGLTTHTLILNDIRGLVSHIRRYKTLTPPLINEAILWHRDSDTAGTELAHSFDWTDDPDPAWQRAAINTAIAAGGYYVGCFSDRFVSDVASSPLKAGSIVNGHLTAPKDDPDTPQRNGRACLDGRGFPNFGVGNTHYIDWVFVPASVVALTPAVLNLAAHPVTPVPDAVTVALTPATMTLTAPVVVPVIGATRVALTPATLPLAALRVTLVAGMVTVALTPALLNLAAVALLPQLPGAVEVPGRLVAGGTGTTLTAAGVAASTLTPSGTP